MGNCCKCFKKKNIDKKSLLDKCNPSAVVPSDGFQDLSIDGGEYSYYTLFDEKKLPGQHSRYSYTTTADQSMNKISREHFEDIKLLGRGSFGKVLLVRKKNNNKLYAMKILKKSVIKKRKQEMHTQTERKILEKISHPFIVSLQYAFQDEKKLYLVTQFMQGGELFYHLRKEKYFSESRAKFYTAELVLAIEHLHSNDCIYRDLKPENILLDKDGHIRITDFGLSKMILSNKNEKAFTICGTAEYLAPEILLETGYDKSVDWWSLGALLYEMLCGYSPFRIEKNNKLDLDAYTKPVYMHPHFSNEAKTLIRALLTVNPKLRLGSGPLGTRNIKSHPFFQDVNFSSLMAKTITPPFIPFVTNSEDLSNFDQMFTGENINDPMSDRNGVLNDINPRYDGFTYEKDSSMTDNSKDIINI